MNYTITVGDTMYTLKRISGGCANPLCEVSILLSDTDVQMIPVLRTDMDTPAPSGSQFNDYKDTADIVWMPFPFFKWDFRRVDPADKGKLSRRNVYSDIALGIITRNNIQGLEGIDRHKDYIKKYFDEYVKFMLDNTVSIIVNKICSKLDNTTKNELAKFLTNKGESLFTMTDDERINLGKEFIDKLSAKHKPNKPQSQSQTAAVIDNLVNGGNAQPSVRNFNRPPFENQRPATVVTPVDDGTVIVDYSALATQPEVVPTIIPPISGEPVIGMSNPVEHMTPPAGMVIPPVVQPPVAEPQPEQAVNAPKIGKAKTDVVDNPPQTKLANQVVALSDIEETDSDKLMDKYPQLKFYADCVGEQFRCEFFLNNKLVSVKVFDKDSGAEVDSMGATFDVVGAILSPEVNKFWAGNDSDIIYDFENPLKLDEATVKTYLAKEDLTDDMYYSSEDACELNRILNARSLWEYTSDQNVVEVMKHVKKILASPKAKQLKKRLANRRLSMTEYTDNTHFVLSTVSGTPAYLGGPKVNEGKKVLKVIINNNDVKTEVA